MKRHSRASGKLVKRERRRGAAPKRSSSSKAVPGHRSEVTIEQTQIAGLAHELAEAQKQFAKALEQTVIGESLRVISNSPSDVQPVLDLVAGYAARICEAQVADIMILEDDVLYDGACYGEYARPFLSDCSEI
jgi:hypothetical protein